MIIKICMCFQLQNNFANVRLNYQFKFQTIIKNDCRFTLNFILNFSIQTT